MFRDPQQLAVLQMMIRLDTNEPIPAPEGGWSTARLTLLAAVARHMAIRSQLETFAAPPDGSKHEQVNEEQWDAYVHKHLSEAQLSVDVSVEYVKEVAEKIDDSGLLWLPYDELEDE